MSGRSLEAQQYKEKVGKSALGRGSGGGWVRLQFSFSASKISAEILSEPGERHWPVEATGSEATIGE